MAWRPVLVGPCAGDLDLESDLLADASSSRPFGGLANTQFSMREDCRGYWFFPHPRWAIWSSHRRRPEPRRDTALEPHAMKRLKCFCIVSAASSLSDGRRARRGGQGGSSWCAFVWWCAASEG